MVDTAELGESVLVPQPEGNLHVITRGAAGTPVLLLSGAGVDNAALSWRHALPALAAEHRVLALDWPKQGGSRPWNGTADHDRMLGCVTAVLDHFGLEQAALVGLSQGGAITLGYAVEHPERVSRLVALAPAGVISFPPVVHQLLWVTARWSLLNRTLPSLVFRSRAACAWFARRGLFAGGHVDDFDAIVDEYHADVLRNGAGSSDWQNGSIGFRRMRVDLRPDLPRIACPALFIQGSGDAGVDPEHTRAAARAVPGARFELIEGAGHWANRQDPGRVNSLIADFLRPLPEKMGS
ncbi:alpha/beta fold hydrolase [Nonomuraea glycinis]|uniref:Hydrolase n=1 Tax=Nonomuraea glycinis TaxID=2047744 RepID=A0A918E7Q2_9ACTN|nr:alpha/beta fold hydrolase [Nonomuraea glycinis]MCA2179339.1 alpha/beta fold hydrolase [Nonomuraea glycinis]GGP09902.1 hydrolase [Nonomuraea glycinis]